MTERHAYTSFKYFIPLQRKEGKFTLILKFCEMYFTKGGKRVFNINLGRGQVVKGLDVAGKVGRATAYDEYVEFEFKDDKIFFNGKEMADAYRNGKLEVEFEKTEKDNPIVNGLVLYDGPKSDTDFSDL